MYFASFSTWPRSSVQWGLKSSRPYLQNLNKIFSNTNTGPVLPKIVRGCPANREYTTPVMEAPNKDSIALCRLKERASGG